MFSVLVIESGAGFSGADGCLKLRVCVMCAYTAGCRFAR